MGSSVSILQSRSSSASIQGAPCPAICMFIRWPGRTFRPWRTIRHKEDEAISLRGTNITALPKGLRVRGMIFRDRQEED